MVNGEAIRMLTHARTLVKGLLREINSLSSSIERAEEKFFENILEMPGQGARSLETLFSERQELSMTLESLYAAKYMLESLDSMLESVENPHRIPVLLYITLETLRRVGDILREHHSAESLYVRIVRGELQGLLEARGVEFKSSEEAESILESLHTSALQTASVQAQKRAAPLPLLHLPSASQAAAV